MAVLSHGCPSSQACLAALLLGSVLASAGCQVERPSSQLPPQEGQQDPDGDAGIEGLDSALADSLVDPDGTWALFLEARYCLDATGFPTIENVVSTWYLVDLEPLGDEAASPRYLRQRLRMCQQEVSAVHLDLVTIIPPAIPATLPAVSVDAFLFGEEPGAAWLSQEHIDLWGLTDISPHDPLPTDPEDPRVIDGDGDGLPGVTVGLYSGVGKMCDVHVVQRTRFQLQGEVYNGGLVKGGFWSELHKEVVGTSNALCATPNLMAESSKPNRFAMLRVDGGAGSPNLDTDGEAGISCAEILAAESALLGSATFSRQARDDEACAEAEGSP